MKRCPGCKKKFVPNYPGRVCCSQRCADRRKGNFAARFWARVNKKGPIAPGMKTPCWLWTGRLEATGYARVKLESSQKQIPIHRASWMLRFGSIPRGKLVLHKCDVRHCARHLFLGTQKDNVQDMLRKGRGNKARGQGHGNAKLTEKQAQRLLQKYALGSTQKELAQEYGLHPMSVHKIVAGKKWAHLQRS